MTLNRREALAAATAVTAGAAGMFPAAVRAGDESNNKQQAGRGLKIVDLRITPIALPDPPILAASGCHGPYFLRNIVELVTDAGIVGIGETNGGVAITAALEKSRKLLAGQSVFAYRKFAPDLLKLNRRCYPGVELACLDAIGRATGRRICELLGGPVREQIPFASYLFFRYASDHPQVLSDPRLADKRGRGDAALDPWGEVRTPEAMAEMAWQFHKKWGFRYHKLKAGVLPPEVELEALKAINDRFGGKQPLRIDPNRRWTMKTALAIGEKLKELPLEYYEDPVDGQKAMGEVRTRTGLPMSTNACVVSFRQIPPAVVNKPIDFVLCDHHAWGGIPACQALGHLAPSLGWTVSQHSNNHAGVTMAAMCHVATVVPQLTCASDTHYPWLVEGADIIEGTNLKITGGEMQLPTAPGVGVNLDRDKLARAHETYQKCGMRNRDDQNTMRRFEPGWERTLF